MDSQHPLNINYYQVSNHINDGNIRIDTRWFALYLLFKGILMTLANAYQGISLLFW